MKDQQSANRQLHEIKGMFQNNQDLTYRVFNMMPIGICITDENGTFTDVNQAYADIYNYTQKELIGENFLKVVPDESQSELNELHSQFMGRKYELSGKWTVKDKFDNRFDILTNAAYLDEDVDKGPRKMTFVVKMEELDQTIDRLRHAVEILESKLQAQSLAESISQHQMRNKLGSIVTIANMLDKTELNDVQRKWIGLIKNAGMDTIEMLDTTKDFAQMERGEYKPEYSEFDVLDLFREIDVEVNTLKETKNSELELCFNQRKMKLDDELVISADRKYLQHLFKNLVVNALEAAPKNSTVTLEARKKSSKGTFVTEIHNPGMIPEGIQEEFFQKYTTSGKEQGTGLGTYIAKMIADIHGGNITFVTSQEEGTTMLVQLPVAKP